MLMSVLAALAAITMHPEDVEISGPEGPVRGTLTQPVAGAPSILLIAGSGPTDRDGNSPMGVTGSAYKQLANGLADEGVATLRFDKRGMFGSSEAVPNANAVTFDDYVEDVRGWVGLLGERGSACTWLAGHSEGSTVALLAAQESENLCGLILIAGGGRPILDLMVDQFRPQLPPEMLTQVEAAFASLKAGQEVDIADVPAPLRSLFGPDLQRFMMSGYTLDPVELLAGIDLPILIIQPAEDIQVPVAEGEMLAAAVPEATYLLLDGVNHTLKPVPAGDRAANLASYSDPDLAIDPRVVAAIADFVKAER
ncbi:alpha/beta hydrolase [Sphingomicrobium sediminis]|uniref:Alpha/beta fold hydrolase n=1 Tax=Sphingomicrobium sediminis TaxID=2950949 RepID=A0A9X2J4A8_9SPHN|nr:alpha/beta fold hydrolase [Sphingomicrobium sediminis]MCM8558176.1 alpha/beta fold hydrolase [Sphingomicrobium sediminis]